MATTAITPRKRLLLLIVLLYHLPPPSIALLIPPLPSEGAELFLSSENSVLSDYSLIKASQFNATHGVWCQSSSNTSNLTVTWYLPNGAQVPTSSDPSLPVYAYSNSTGQAGLLRTGLLGNHQGLYNCLVRNGSTGMIISSLFVAAIRDTEYNSAVGSSITGGVDFSLLSPRGSQDVAFSLSFNVSVRPPTDVSCTLNSSAILISPNDIEREVLGSTLGHLLVQVAVTIRLRKAGQYRCTVNNSRVDGNLVSPGDTDNVSISVTDPPLNANATRTGLTSLTVRWSPPPPPLSSPLLGYEVFYAYNATIGEGKVKEMLNSVLVSNVTYQVVLDQLLLDKNYQIFVIAFGGDLPSQRSNTITTSTGVDFTFISLPPPPPLFGDTNISLVCEVSVNITQLSFGLLWLGPQLDVISNDSTDVLSQFGHSRRRIEIIIDLIDSNNAGLYTCMAIFHSNNVTVSRGYELIAQAPELSVNLYTLYNGELIEGTYSDLICNATNIDTSLTNVTWYYNEEPLVNGSDYTIGLKEGRHTLTINQLSFSRDNGGVYKCAMTVPNSTYVIGTEDSANITLSVQRFVSSHISISVVFSEQIPVYGSNFTMQCLVVLPVRFVSRPTKLSAQDQQSIPFGTPPFRDIFDSRVTNEGLVGNGNVYMQNNVFSPVLARDTDVKYRCSVTVNGITKNSNEFDLRIRLSPPVLSFESQTLMVYESTRLVIRCNVVTPTFDYDVLEEGQWRGPDGKIITETDRIEITGSTGHNSFDTNVLTINPADNGDFSQYNDTGFYTYNSTFEFPTGSKILPASSQATIYVNIIDLPPLQVSINASGSNYFGQNVTLSCSVVPISGLQISIKWIHERMVLANNSDKSSTATLSLNNLVDRMSGVYTCEASYDISRTNDNSTVQEDYQLNVEDLGSPQNFRVTRVTSFLIQVSWDSPPIEVYGIFNSYRLYISYSNGSNDSIVLLASSETTFQLEELSPYQMIQFKLSVVYPIGEGPAVTVNQTTHQNKSSPVVDLTLRYNTSHLVINWSPPLQPNGRIEYYTLTLKEYEGMIVRNVTINIDSLLSVAINGLESGVPYNLTVHPVNGFGLGEKEYRLFFVEEKSPSTVSDVALNRVNGTHAIVTWSQLSLTESRGFLQNYTIEYSIAADRGKRQVRTTTVPSNQSNVTLYDLTPSRSYEVSVFASTNAGPGTASQPEILDRPITLKFQVQVRPNTTCSVTDESLKEAIRSSIVNTLASNCSCSFQEGYISGEIFTCADDGSAYYRANVTSFGVTNSSKLVEYIETWVSTFPRIQMGSLIFSFDPTCPTQYNSNEDPACHVPPSETPTTTNDDNNNLVLIIVVIVVVMVMLLVLIIISGIIVYYLYRKNKSKTRDHLEMQPHFANYYKGEIKRSDMIPEEEEDEIYEPLDPDGNLMPAALNKRGASLPMISTLPLPPPPTTATSTAQQSVAQAFKSNRTQSMIVTSSTPTRLLPLPPIPPTESGTTVSSSSVPMNGEKAGPHAALSESLPFQLGGTKVSSPINFVPGLGSLSEENEDNNKRNTIIAGAKGNKPKPFSISSSGGSVHSMSSKRASQLTTISQSMSDRGPVSPSGTTTSINSPATPSSAMSPQYSTPFSPLYANADEKGGGQKGGGEGIRNKDVKTNKEEEEDQYISMKSPAYTEVKKIPPSSSSAQEYIIPVVSSGSFEKLLGVADVQAHEYETPVSSRGGTPVPTVRPGGGGGGGGGEVRSMSPPSRDRVSSTNSISSRDGASFSIDESGLYSRPIFPNIYQESNNEATGTPQEYEVPVLSPSHRSPPPTASGSDWLYAEPHLHASPVSPTHSDSLPQNYLVPVVTKPHSSTSSSPPPSLPQEYEVPIVSSRETTPKSPSPPPTSPPPPATSPPPPATSPPPPATSPPPPATSPPPFVTSPDVPSPASSPPDSPTLLASPKVPLRDLEVETGKHEEKQPPEADKVIPDTEEENKVEQEMEKEKEDHSKEEEASNNGKEAENASTEGVKAEVEEANEEKELKEEKENKIVQEMGTDEDEEKQPPEADIVIPDTEEEEENKAEQEMEKEKEDHGKEEEALNNSKELEDASTEGVKAEEEEDEEANEEKELKEGEEIKQEVETDEDEEKQPPEADEVMQTDEDEEKQPPEADKVMVTDEDEEKQPPEADKVMVTDEDEEKQPPEADKVMQTDEDEEKQPPEVDKVICDTEEENKAEQEMDIKKEDHKEEAENVSTEGVKAEEDENEEVNEKELNEVSDLRDEVANNSDSGESGIEADEDNENGDSEKELDEDPIINNSLMRLEKGKVEKELTNDTKGDTSGMNGKPISGETFHDGNDEEIGTKL